MHSIEIQENMNLSNSFSAYSWAPQMEKNDLFKIKLYIEKELWEKYVTFCVKYTFLLLLVLLKILASCLEFFLTT